MLDERNTINPRSAKTNLHPILSVDLMSTKKDKIVHNDNGMKTGINLLVCFIYV